MADRCGYIIRVENLRPHPNADRLQILHVFEADTCVSLDVKVGDIGMYVPADVQLGEDFCRVNDLVRRKNPDGSAAGGFLEENRRVRAIGLRGVKSEGVYLPITSLANFCKISDLKVGDQITVLNGVEICTRYIPKTHTYHGGKDGSKVQAPKKNICPLFSEHCETEQLAYNLDKFHCGDTIQLTIKLHGTSQRVGHLPIIKERPQNFFERLFKRPVKTYTEYGYITGTRRVVMGENRNGGFYDSDEWRYAMTEKFVGKLPKNMEVFFEVVGFQGPHGAPIMPAVQNSKIKDRQFTNQYGSTTVFSYGCDPDGDYEFHSFLESGREFDKYPCCDIYVYRITMVNEDGEVIELSPDQIHMYCEKWGVNCVPEVARFIIPDDVNPGEYVLRQVEQYFDGPDPIGKTHIREGVVARICNHSNFDVYKHKNFYFKVLSGLAIDQAEETGATEGMSQDMLEEM